MHTLTYFGCVETSDIESVLNELSELLVFDHDLSDTQDRLRCWRNGIYILWFISSHCEKNSGERFRAHGPFCFLNVVMLHIKLKEMERSRTMHAHSMSFHILDLWGQH